MSLQRDSTRLWWVVMSDLDEKLDNAIAKARMVYTESMQPDMDATNRELRESVKQVFKDAGWHEHGTAIPESVARKLNIMTGIEWYEGFKGELAKPWTAEDIVEPYYQHDDQTYVYTADHVIEAAEKASGIE